MLSRRSALKHVVVAGATAALAGPAALRAGEAAAPVAGKARFSFGVASISLKSLPLENMLVAVKRLGLGRISLFRGHSPWENEAAQWREAAAKIRASGIEIGCCGVLYLKNDEAAMRHLLDYARALGVKLFSCSLEPAALPLLDRLIKEYDLQAAIHNHGPEDKIWPGPRGIWEAIQSLDPRIGLCLDIGHCYRAGEDPADAVRRYRARLYDVHAKDSLAKVGDKDTPVEMGRGVIDLRRVLTALIETGYAESVWLEYEKDPDDSLPGLAESIGYLRGVLRGLNAAETL